MLPPFNEMGLKNIELTTAGRRQEAESWLSKTEGEEFNSRSETVNLVLTCLDCLPTPGETVMAKQNPRPSQGKREEDGSPQARVGARPCTGWGQRPVAWLPASLELTLPCVRSPEPARGALSPRTLLVRAPPEGLPGGRHTRSPGRRPGHAMQRAAS